MCQYYASADPIMYESRTRTIRIHGVQTSVRVENFVWDTLACLATEEGLTTNALLVQFHDEILRYRDGDGVQNFSSFLRITCIRYLRRKCEQLQSLQPQASSTTNTVKPTIPKNLHH